MSSLNVITNGAPPTAPAAAAPVVADAAPGSALALARAAAARQRQRHTTDIPVGGDFGEHLKVRYGVLPLDEIERYSELAQTTSWSLNLDVMTSACQTVLWDDTDLEVGLDHRLWTLLDWPLPAGIDRAADLTPRELIDALFGSNGIALADHFARLQKWMENPGGDAPGESSAAGG
jgi:hypothetical protein